MSRMQNTARQQTKTQGKYLHCIVCLSGMNFTEVFENK